jgi:hypothetical protein
MRQIRGFLPWLGYSLAAALVDWRLAALAAFAIAVTGLAAQRRSSGTDVFTVAAVAFFAGLALDALAAPTGTLHQYVGALMPAALGVAAFTSIAIGQPFTIPFAKRVAPVEYWDTPLFMHINAVLSAVWATSFVAIATVIATVLVVDPQAGVIIVAAQILGFVIPMRISRRYPASVRARAMAA